VFTGIIEDIGNVVSITPSGSGYSMCVKSSKICLDLNIGDSVAVDGVCQTVETIKQDQFQFFISKVTAQVTNLSMAKAGDKVNLERALRLNSRLGGHIVQGHVDDTASIIDIENDVSGMQVKLKIANHLTKYIIHKGSICVNGISLTVADCSEDTFSIYLIPETLKSTNAVNWKKGDKINIETDIMAKYAEKLLKNADDSPHSSDEKFLSLLSDGGFM
jgi:riboflavin synthase